MFGVLPGIIGLLQATEAIKLLLGMPTSLSGVLLLYDAQSMTFDTLRFKADADRPKVVDLSQAASMLSDEAWCMNERGQSESPQEQKSPPTSVGGMFNHLSMADFMQRRDEGWTPFILDVRSDAEYADARVAACDLQVPHSTIHGALIHPQNADVVIFCKSGCGPAAIELIKSDIRPSAFTICQWNMAWNATAPDEYS